MESSHPELSALWGYRWLLLLIVVVATGGAYLIAKGQPKSYTSHALVQIIPGSTAHGNLLTADEIQSITNTYLEIARTQPVFQRIATQLSTPGKPVKVTDVNDRTDAKAPQSGVTVIELFGSAKLPTHASLLANAYASNFAGYVGELQSAQQAQAAAPIRADIAAQQAILRSLPAGDPRRQLATTQLGIDINQLTSLGAGSNEDTARILEPATAPTSPSSPHPTLDALLALLASAFLGTALLYAYVSLSDHYRSVDEVTADLDLPVLAEIPRSKPTDPRSFEAFRRLRTAVMFALQEPTPQGRPDDSRRRGLELLITAADEGTGKTFVTTNLARSLASAGWKTVVVDSDMRRPAAHAEFGVALRPGLSDALSDDPREIETFAREVPLPDATGGRSEVLRLVPAGNPVTDSTERLLSTAMSEAVDVLVHEFDVVLFDSAPLEPVVDAVILSRYTQGVVVVVDMRHTRRRSVRRAVQLLRAADAPVLGIVLNRAALRSVKEGYYLVPEKVKSPAPTG